MKINGKECYCDEEVFRYIVRSDDEREIITAKYNETMKIAQKRLSIIQQAIKYINNYSKNFMFELRIEELEELKEILENGI